MADELKDQRVVTMMSPSELQAIDDWMFTNRVRSRGEAIRRLCQFAIALDERIPALYTDVAKLTGSTANASDSLKKWENDANLHPELRVTLITAELAYNKALLEILNLTENTLLESLPYRLGKDTTEALAIAQHFREQLSSPDAGDFRKNLRKSLESTSNDGDPSPAT